MLGLSEMRLSNLRHALAEIDAHAATQLVQARQASDQAAAIAEPQVSICVRQRAMVAFNVNTTALMSRRDEYGRANVSSFFRQAFNDIPPMQQADLTAYDVPRWQHQCRTERASLAT